jgi:aminopeptidase N
MDQFRGNHKLNDTVHDTDHANFIYDSISYYKGASIFKYLHSIIGNESFFKVIKEFFNKADQSHSNYNVFLNTLSTLSSNKQKLTGIVEPFIDNRGLNNLLCTVHEENGFIKEFCVTQHPCTHATIDQYYTYDVEVSILVNVLGVTCL